ncbi:hypothetical protein JCM18899A_23540 [Nocardioides sp. AN3]
MSSANVGPAWASRRLPHAPTASPLARHALRSYLGSLGAASDAIADAELVLGELVANAVMHGEPDADGMFEAAWRAFDDTIQISVHDEGHVKGLTPRHASPTALSGRGLEIVAHVCDRWWCTVEDGTRVSAELSLLATG